MNKPYKYSILNEKILMLEYIKDTNVDLKLLKKIREEAFDLCENKPYYSIVNMNGVKLNFTEEAKKKAANDQEWNKLRVSEAIYTDSFIISLLIGGYLKIYKPPVLTKAFSNFEDALNWTKKQQKR